MKNEKILFFLGRPFGPIYSLVMGLRAWLYAKGFKKVHRLPVPVISVGNLTMGGTGKTPMVLHLARLTQEKYHPAIISRGYGGKAHAQINLVSDGQKILLSPEQAGDEPLLLATSLPSIPVITGPKRVLTGGYAVEHQGAELLIMDDGFQHMSLHRDLNIALFSATALLGNGRVCPAGPLREPIQALQRADCFVFTGVNKHNRSRAIDFAASLTKRFPATPCFFGEYKATGLQALGSEKIISPEMLKNTPLLGFCGIATPDSFESSLHSLGLSIPDFRAFRDHHPFSQTDVRDLQEMAKQANCQGLICTAKDQVKLAAHNWYLPVWTVLMDLVMEPNFDQFILRHLESFRPD